MKSLVQAMALVGALGAGGLALSGAVAPAQAHEPVSYTDKCPLTKNSWESPNGSRMAEIALASAEKSRHP
jgi:hypothetical protein